MGRADIYAIRYKEGTGPPEWCCLEQELEYTLFSVGLNDSCY